MKRKQLIAPMMQIFLVVMATGALSADEKFPHRVDYPQVETDCGQGNLSSATIILRKKFPII